MEPLTDRRGGAAPRLFELVREQSLDGAEQTESAGDASANTGAADRMSGQGVSIDLQVENDVYRAPAHADKRRWRRPPGTSRKSLGADPRLSATTPLEPQLRT
jgi:hypothetical protein